MWYLSDLRKFFSCDRKRFDVLVTGNWKRFGFMEAGGAACFGILNMLPHWKKLKSLADGVFCCCCCCCCCLFAAVVVAVVEVDVAVVEVDVALLKLPFVSEHFVAVVNARFVVASQLQLKFQLSLKIPFSCPFYDALLYPWNCCLLQYKSRQIRYLTWAQEANCAYCSRFHFCWLERLQRGQGHWQLHRSQQLTTRIHRSQRLG